MENIVIPSLNSEEKLERTREKFLLVNQMDNWSDPNLLKSKLKEINDKYNISEISEEELFLIKKKLDLFDKESNNLILFIEEIIESKYSINSQYKIFSDKKYNIEINKIITNKK